MCVWDISECLLSMGMCAGLKLVYIPGCAVWLVFTECELGQQFNSQ